MRFLPLLLTVFIDSLGFGLVFPMLGMLIMQADGGMMPVEASVATRGWVFGLLVSCFCMGQFFGGPILGALSDRKGRKKVLLATLVLAFFGYILGVVSLWSQSIFLFLFSRIVSGVAAGNFSIAQSMVVDSSSEDKAKNFGLIGMAWGAGFILGPYFGGQLATPDLWRGAMPLCFAAALCLVNLIWLLLAVKETLPVAQIRKINFMAGFEDLKKAFSHPKLRGIFLVMFIFSFGWGFFTEFSALFLIRRLDFNQQQIGYFYAWVGIWVALSQGVFIRPFLKRFSPQALLRGALLGLGLVLPLMLLVHTSFYLFLLLPLLALFESFIFPTASTIVSDLTSKEAQGEILGVHSSIQWAAIGIAPLFSGSVVALYPHLPITVASAGMFLAYLLFLWIWRRKPVET
ncbi:MAG: MFS transporter [Chlamydiales bacterium]|nr:MFS transporter [Chlamydiales bacterium]